MYLHDPCRFHPIYTRSHSPSGPATTPQNGSSCGTFYSGVTAVERNKILRPPNIGDGGTGIGGSILPMSSHGLVSSALFLCVGVLYDRHKTRLVRYYGGSVSTMPNLSTIFFSSTLANMSSPGTSSFIGEFLILVGAFQRNSLVATLAALGMILGAAYSLWLYNRAVSGNLKPDFLHKFSDPNGREVSIFIPFLVGGATGWGGLLGETDRKKGRGATMHGTSRPCLRGTVELATHECCRVGRANNSKAFGLFFEQESQPYLIFTMIRTPSSYGRARGDLSSI
ncbi:hypothetical protein RDI58_023624 [Solanum bulbocastanum]|uniref:NADH-ubiquinone oxidoreductase chain 4 n=1 Tax=Solanum bulbocastanum TaxID=147425 RepID=A0AAN8Y0J7_SOLBU